MQTFWVDSKTKMQSSKEFKHLDSAFVPLYDRGYASALTLTDGASGLDGYAYNIFESFFVNK